MVHDDVWYEATLRRDQILWRWGDRLRDGIRALGPTTPAGRRLAETLEFIRFLETEMPALQARWEEHRANLTVTTKEA